LLCTAHVLLRLIHRLLFLFPLFTVAVLLRLRSRLPVCAPHHTHAVARVATPHCGLRLTFCFVRLRLPLLLRYLPLYGSRTRLLLRYTRYHGCVYHTDLHRYSARSYTGYCCSLTVRCLRLHTTLTRCAHLRLPLRYLLRSRCVAAFCVYGCSPRPVQLLGLPLLVTAGFFFYRLFVRGCYVVRLRFTCCLRLFATRTHTHRLRTVVAHLLPRTLPYIAYLLRVAGYYSYTVGYWLLTVRTIRLLLHAIALRLLPFVVVRVCCTRYRLFTFLTFGPRLRGCCVYPVCVNTVLPLVVTVIHVASLRFTFTRLLFPHCSYAHTLRYACFVTFTITLRS